MSAGTYQVRADELCEGELVDLEGDSVADPAGDTGAFKYELCRVVEVNPMLYGRVEVTFEDTAVVFPGAHKVTVVVEEVP
jgi:hypothetical protein